MRRKKHNLSDDEVASYQMYKDTNLPIGLSYTHMSNDMRTIYKGLKQKERDEYNKLTRKFRQTISDEHTQRLYDTLNITQDVQNAINAQSAVIIEKIDAVDSKLDNLKSTEAEVQPQSMTRDEILAEVDKLVEAINLHVAEERKKANRELQEKLQKEAEEKKKSDKQSHDILKEVQGTFKKLADYIPLIWLGLATLARLLEDAFGNIFSRISSAVSNAISTVTTTVTNAFNTVKTTVTNTYKKVNNYVNDKMDAVLDFLGVDTSEYENPSPLTPPTLQPMSKDKRELFSKALASKGNISILRNELQKKPKTEQSVSATTVPSVGEQFANNSTSLLDMARSYDKPKEVQSPTTETDSEQTPYTPMPRQKVTDVTPIINNTYQTTVNNVNISQREIPFQTF